MRFLSKKQVFLKSRNNHNRILEKAVVVWQLIRSCSESALVCNRERWMERASLFLYIFPGNTKIDTHTLQAVGFLGGNEFW